jgi:hypothetical protein
MSSTPRLLCSSHKFNTDHLEKISGLLNEKISGLTKEGAEVGVLAEWFDLHPHRRIAQGGCRRQSAATPRGRQPRARQEEIRWRPSSRGRVSGPR